MEKKKFVFTRHASNVINERSIQIEWVEEILWNPEFIEPDKVDPSLEHRLGPVPDYEGRMLRIVINHSVDPFRIVTVYFDRKMKGKK